ncbi:MULTISPECIES: hypothetical protein [Thiothrix]|jgi:hypothetical protein|uniref:hypothetical protein n=1 Tax=Thiothrix TaxID=1030 RepID=UPI00257FC113|nr:MULTISPECIES: hypothetical protein [Thiothrix]MDX9987402.1 hypothetical protein [Thiothrix unzii]
MNKQFDQLAQHLEQKHRHRLEAMTRTALQTPPPSTCLSWLHLVWIKPLRLRSATTVMVSALAASAAIAVVLLIVLPEKSPTPPATLVTLPDWVKDTDVPLTLLTNMDFYDWLAQQPDNQSAQAYDLLALADDRFPRFGTSGRYPAADFAKRLPRGFARD